MKNSYHRIINNLLNKVSILLILISTSFLSCKNKPSEKSGEELMKTARDICVSNLILDSHIDWPEWLLDFPEDISGRTTKGDFDLERSKEGGLNAALSVVYIPPKLNTGEGRKMVDTLMYLITDYTKKYPGKFALATSPGDVLDNFGKNLFSMIPCLENGSPIGNDMNYLKHLKKNGIAYITLCHSKVNQISDSNFDPERKWNGLSPFGKDLVREMNHLGIMVDISHSSDSTVYQALRISEAPIIASHSSCRYFVHGFERNLPDTLIKAIAAKGGIVMVNLCSAFLDSSCSRSWNYLYAWSDSTGTDLMSDKGVEFTRKYGETHKLFADSKAVADHIDHIIKVTGDMDHVGIGSDYDGIGYMQPVDLPDVSSYPTIVYELLKRGYKESDITKILSGNFLRVWENVQKYGESAK